MASTVSMLLNVFATKSRHRELKADYRAIISELPELTETYAEVSIGETFSINAENFAALQLTEEVTATVTTFKRVDGVLTANDSVEMTLKGMFVHGGKILISINNPSDNTVDLPYHVSAIYG